jgi:hypothetical protein
MRKERDMGFLDKVKAGAEQAIQSGQQALQQGQEKLDEVQAKKKADGLLRDLGAWHYAIETSRDEGDARDEIARITAELAAHEAENGPIPVGRKEEPPPPPPPAPPAAGPPPPPGAVPPPPPGAVPPPPPGAVPPPPPGAVPPPPPSGSF